MANPLPADHRPSPGPEPAARAMMRPTINRGTVLVLALILLVACSDRNPQPVTFRYQLASAPNTLDPAQMGYLYSAAVIDRIFDGLLRLDRVHATPQPELAESYTVSADGLVYEFRLRNNARFHNHRPVRAADVKYSWERVLAPETDSPSAWFLDLIAGVRDFRDGSADHVSGIEVVDRFVVRVRLRKPFAPFPYHLAFAGLSIVPPEAVEPSFRPLGSGPFRFVRWKGQQIELAAFEDHPTRPPEVDRLVFQVIPGHDALQLYFNGELDLVSQIPSGSLGLLKQTHPRDLHIFPDIGWYGFCFRCDQPPFDDIRLRRAFALAVDREELTRDLGELQYAPVRGFLPATLPGHDLQPEGAQRDPERAGQLLAAAGFAGGQGLPPQVLITKADDDYAPFVVASLAQLGVAIRAEPGWFIDEAFSGKYRLFRRGWVGDYPDPEPYLRPLFHSDGSANYTAYSNPAVDRLLDAAQIEQDPALRHSLYQRAEATIIADAPCVPLFEKTQAILLRPCWQGIPVGYEAKALEIELARQKPDSTGS